MSDHFSSNRNKDELIGRVPTARKLGIHPNTLDANHRAGIGPKRIQLSRRRVAYRETDVEAYLAGSAA